MRKERNVREGKVDKAEHLHLMFSCLSLLNTGEKGRCGGTPRPHVPLFPLLAVVREKVDAITYLQGKKTSEREKP